MLFRLQIYINGIGDFARGKKIQISDFEVASDKVCCLSYYYAGKRIKEYRLNIKKMICSKQTEDIILELDSLDIIDQGYVSFGEGVRNIGNEFSKIYLTSDEKVIIRKIKL